MVAVVERVIELFDSTCIKQFESMSCAIHPLYQAESTSGMHSATETISSVIDCRSDDLEICLLLNASKGFLVKTMPLIGGQRIELVSFLEDWCLELSNRFLGRLKNKLLSHGCNLQMGLPEICRDVTYQKFVHQDDSMVCRVFQIDNDHGGVSEMEIIECQLFIRMKTPDLVIEDYEDEDEDWFDESELHNL